MTLIDDLRRIAAMPDKQEKADHIANTLWIFERNPFLPEQEIAQGLAFMVEDYLHEDDLKVREHYTRTLSLLLVTRESVAGEIDWDALIRQLPEIAHDEVYDIVWMLGAAPDEKYLAILESCLDDIGLSERAANSWVRLAYRTRYQNDWQISPYMQEASKALRRNYEKRRQDIRSQYGADVYSKVFRGNTDLLPEKERLHYRALMREVIERTTQRIRQEVQLVARTKAEVEQHYKASLGYFPNYIREQFIPTVPFDPVTNPPGSLDWIFQNDVTIPIDEFALAIRFMVDHAFKQDDAKNFTRILSTVPIAFGARCYVGTYLDWSTLLKQTEELEHLYQERSKNTSRITDIVLSFYGYANDATYQAMIDPYLEHPLPYVSLIAAQATVKLLFQLCHYAPPVSRIYYKDVYHTLETLKVKHISAKTHPPELRREIRVILDRFEQSARPYIHYYSI